MWLFTLLPELQVWNSDTSDEAKRSIQSDLVSDEPDMRLLYTTPGAAGGWQATSTCGCFSTASKQLWPAG